MKPSSIQHPPSSIALLSASLLLNRDFQLPGDGWYHVLPFGEYPHPEGVTQVFDQPGAERMLNRFRESAKQRNFPGILVDFDHFSHEPDKPSEAAGWATDLQNRSDGLYAQIRWSDTGEAAVKGGRYRLISPVVDLSETLSNKRVRPTRLLRLALTNDPNLKGMVPLSNRDTARAGTDTPGTTNNKEKQMKSVCTLLDLSPDASEEAVHAAVLKLKNRGDISAPELVTLRNRATTLETENKELRGTRVTQALETYKNRFKPEQKDRYQKLLETDYENAIAILKDAPEIGKQPNTALHNRGGARTPNPDVLHNRGGNGTEQERNEDAERDLANKAEAEVQDYMLRNRCGYEQATNAVRMRKPELFGLPVHN